MTKQDITQITAEYAREDLIAAVKNGRHMIGGTKIGTITLEVEKNTLSIWTMDQDEPRTYLIIDQDQLARAIEFIGQTYRIA